MDSVEVGDSMNVNMESFERMDSLKCCSKVSHTIAGVRKTNHSICRSADSVEETRKKPPDLGYQSETNWAKLGFSRQTKRQEPQAPVNAKEDPQVHDAEAELRRGEERTRVVVDGNAQTRRSLTIRLV